MRFSFGGNDESNENNELSLIFVFVEENNPINKCISTKEKGVL